MEPANKAICNLNSAIWQKLNKQDNVNKRNNLNKQNNWNVDLIIKMIFVVADIKEQ